MTPSARPWAGPGVFRNLGYLSAFRRHYPNAFLELSRKYGRAFRIHLPFPAIFAGEPGLIRYVLKQNAKNYVKGPLYEPLRPLLGNGLVTSDGEHWKRSRRTIAPEFHAKSIDGFVEAMVRHSAALEQSWKARIQNSGGTAVLDLSDEMMALTLSIVSEVFFGEALDSKSKEIAEHLYVLLEQSIRDTLDVVKIPKSWPTAWNRKVALARQGIDRVVSDLIMRRREALNSDRRDVLSRLLLARDPETGEALTDTELLDEVKTLMLAGHETTSLALTWACYLLAKNPEAKKKIQAETDAVLSGRACSLGDVMKLTYTRAVMMETMRLFPPVPVVSRQAITDDEFEGRKIPAGSIVQIAPYVTHRDPEFWEGAEAFIPERFLEGHSKAARISDERLIYFPFAFGPRACVGEHFAMTEAVVLLSHFAGRFDFELLDPGAVVESEALNTLRPKGGMKLRVSLRSNY